MSEHFNGLTPAEAERLAFLIEELAEAQQAACKILRHGYASHNPTSPPADRVTTNRQRLEEELGHVDAALGLMLRSLDLDGQSVIVSSRRKRNSVRRWMHHQGAAE